jgi:hypothetical protein
MEKMEGNNEGISEKEQKFRELIHDYSEMGEKCMQWRRN